MTLDLTIACHIVSCSVIYIQGCLLGCHGAVKFLWKCLYQVRAIAVFPVFRLLTNLVCLLTYEFCLSLWKIARCSVILLVPLFMLFNSNKTAAIYASCYHNHRGTTNEEFEDFKGVTRICKSEKDKQHNGQKKKDKWTNNDLQNIHIKHTQNIQK